MTPYPAVVDETNRIRRAARRHPRGIDVRAGHGDPAAIAGGRLALIPGKADDRASCSCRYGR